MSIDPNDFTVIKEGEAEILMLPKNKVFYNKTQVDNRDLSIAVLREFVKRRKQEHDAMLSAKRNRGRKDVVNVKDEVEGSGSGETSNRCVEDGEKTNGEFDKKMELPVAKENTKSEGSGLGVNGGEKRKRNELKPARVLEALSASGLRALRYAREVEDLGEVVALDNDKNSVEACRRNIKFNGAVASAKVKSELVDACEYMLSHQKEFDMVDLDPYGSPSIFLDCAVRSVVDGGMLMCTATDMAVLCGTSGEVCYSKYGSYPLKGKYSHEMALRILLNCIESHANRHKRYIVPVLSVQMDFYVRVFVRIYTSAVAMKNTPAKLSYVYQCTGCDSFHFQPLGMIVSKKNSVGCMPGFGPVVSQECSDCGKRYNMGGPIWTDPIHDQEWVASILADVTLMKDRYPAYGRISAVLTTVSEELPDVPLFLCLHHLCRTLKCTSPSAQNFRSAVINAGYRISGTHVSPLGMKSDAPMDIIWDIMRCWVKSHPVKPQPPETSGTAILAKEPVLQANFARAAASISRAQAKKVARFLPNPESHWGPKIRAGRTVTAKHVSLLGPEAVNGRHLSLEEGEVRNGKRQKTDNPASDSEA